MTPADRSLPPDCGAMAEEAWKLAPRGMLPLCCWDGDYVVYNPLSGNTHFLDILTGRMLAAIASAPAVGQADLRRLAAEFLEVADDDRLAAHVAETLGALDELGLIEPVQSC